jgi:hypothetical protein
VLSASPFAAIKPSPRIMNADRYGSADETETAMCYRPSDGWELVELLLLTPGRRRPRGQLHLGSPAWRERERQAEEA